MKKIVVVVISILFAYNLCNAKTHLPDAVTKSFNQKFPNATNVKWDKENDHEFEAGFKWNSEKFSANFNDKGDWLETESTITFNKLPEKVQQSFNAANKGAKVKAVAKIENSKGEIKFEIEIKQKSKTIEKMYSVDGSELKK
jgi:hypothetical protein